MDYIKEYKSFIHSHYLNGAIRITVGIVLPSVLLGYFNDLSSGIAVSIGAMCVGNTDNPGPIHHRRNGMIACILIIFVTALLTGAVAGQHVLTGILVCTCCFLFSMIGVYGSRATSIGINGLLVMVLNIDRHQQGWAILTNALLVLAGGVWYTVLSLLLYSFRPYKLVQQAMGECVEATADYLRTKAHFYGKAVDYDKYYRQLVQQQVGIHEKQELLRELLFKSRDIVKETTSTGRVLLMIFQDIVDLFERVMTSQQDYPSLHRLFDGAGILSEYQELIMDMAGELDEIGIAIKSGRPSVETARLATRIRLLRESFAKFREEQLTAENVEGFIGLRHILESIQDIADRLHTLHGYTTYDASIDKTLQQELDLDYELFISHQDMDKKLLWESLSLQSNIFRHSLRMSIATTAGYLISRLLPFGHGYWILLTIIVILKPAYSLTKKRNYERLIGTLAGGLVGLLVLYFVKDHTAIFIMMILFMIGTYVFIRTNYLICVTMTTPYVLLLFHLLYPVDFHSILSDRIIDTALGSAIAFIASISIVPSWEREQIRDYMIRILQANADYFRNVAGPFAGIKISEEQYKLSRKQAYVALANLSDAFSRILSEPGRKKEQAGKMHQFVVSTHMLTSHIATLAYYERNQPMNHISPALLAPVVDAITLRLERTRISLEAEAWLPSPSPTPSEEPTSVFLAEGLPPENLPAPVSGDKNPQSPDDAAVSDTAVTDTAVTDAVRSDATGSVRTAVAKEDLRLLNERLGLLVDKRKSELGQGITDSSTRTELTGLKPVVDQFNFIAKVSGNIEQLCRELVASYSPPAAP